RSREAEVNARVEAAEIDGRDLAVDREGRRPEEERDARIGRARDDALESLDHRDVRRTLGLPPELALRLLARRHERLERLEPRRVDASREPRLLEPARRVRPALERRARHLENAKAR